MYKQYKITNSYTGVVFKAGV